ncbi:MAG: hypothetical protein ACOY3L_00810, partial [Pseudomonadota bacterium]
MAQPTIGTGTGAATMTPPLGGVGSITVIQVAPGQQVELPITPEELAQSQVQIVGNDAEIILPDGRIILLVGFVQAVESDTPPELVATGGATIEIAQLLDQMGMSLEELATAAGGPQAGTTAPNQQASFTPGEGPNILDSIADAGPIGPTALTYGLPEPLTKPLDVFQEGGDLGGPTANDDGPNGPDGIAGTEDDVGCVKEETIFQKGTNGEDQLGGEVFVPQSVGGNVLTNDDFGPDGPGGIVGIEYTGGLAVTRDDSVPGQVTFTADDGSWTMVFNLTTGDYLFTLTGPYQHGGPGPDEALESFRYTIEDVDGDQSSANLAICIDDDVPTARNDTDSVAAGQFTAETGNVITGVGTTSGVAGADTEGADGAAVSKIAGSGGSDGTFDGSGWLEVAGDYGVLKMKADGSYEYLRNADSKGGVTDTFTYTLTETDGEGAADDKTATLKIDIGDSDVTLDTAPAGGGDRTVYEAGLDLDNRSGADAPGSDAGSSSEITTGFMTVASPDGVSAIAVGGNPVNLAGPFPQTLVDDATGKLEITGWSWDSSTHTGQLAYRYTLEDNTQADPSSASFGVVVTDLDGDTDNGTLTMAIVDDVPTARNDTDSVAAGQFTAETGNVITGVGTTSGVAGADTEG